MMFNGTDKVLQYKYDEEYGAKSQKYFVHAVHYGS